MTSLLPNFSTTLTPLTKPETTMNKCDENQTTQQWCRIIPLTVAWNWSNSWYLWTASNSNGTKNFLFISWQANMTPPSFLALTRHSSSLEEIKTTMVTNPFSIRNSGWLTNRWNLEEPRLHSLSWGFFRSPCLSACGIDRHSLPAICIVSLPAIRWYHNLQGFFSAFDLKLPANFALTQEKCWPA